MLTVNLQLPTWTWEVEKLFEVETEWVAYFRPWLFRPTLLASRFASLETLVAVENNKLLKFEIDRFK